MIVPEWQDGVGGGEAEIASGLNTAAILEATPAPGSMLAGVPGDGTELLAPTQALMHSLSVAFSPLMLAHMDAALAHARARAAEALAANAAAWKAQADDKKHGARDRAEASHRASGPDQTGTSDRAAEAAATTRQAAAAATKTAQEATAILSDLGGNPGSDGFDGAVVDAVSAAALIDIMGRLEDLKNAAAAAQAQAAVLLDTQQRLTQVKAGVSGRRAGRGIGEQIGLARRESPHLGSQHLALATTLVRGMPLTMADFGAGIHSEWRATVIAQETAFLTPENRAIVDATLSADRDSVAGMGTRQLGSTVRSLAYKLEPESFVQRLNKAATDRYVSLRPAADGMTLLTALVPLRQGVTIINTLTRIAERTRNSGDERTRGQIMADALIHRLITHTQCPAADNDADLGREGATTDSVRPVAGPARFVDLADTGTAPVVPTSPAEQAGNGTRPAGIDEAVGPATGPGAPSPSGGWTDCGRCLPSESGVQLELIMTDRALFDGADDPAIIPGYGPVPAPMAREWVTGSSADSDYYAGDNFRQERLGRKSRVWIRRLYTHPDTGALLAMDSASRIFPEGLKHFLKTRDQVCRTPWCDAPVRQYDHIKSYATGGETSAENGAGLCQRCNLVKETPGWSVAVPPPGPVPESDASKGTGTTGRSTLHRTIITTPTGHRYNSQSPPLPGFDGAAKSKISASAGAEPGEVVPVWPVRRQKRKR